MSEHREFFRKRTKSTGYVLRDSGEIQFLIRDLSVEGFQAHFDSEPPFATNEVVSIRMPDLRLQGKARAVRIVPDGPEGARGYQAGFLFTERSPWDPSSVFMSQPRV